MAPETNSLFYTASMCFVRPDWVNDYLRNITGKNIKVAVIDSGCGVELLNDSRIIKGISFVKKNPKFESETNSDYSDKLGHGTACIDRILQVAPGATVVPIKIFNKFLETSPEILINAMNYAIESEVNIINLSLSSKLEELLRPLYILCEKAKNKNIIIVASYANTNETSYPAVFDNVISVSAKHFYDTFDFSFHDDEFVECNAVGASSDVLGLNHTRAYACGNSYAAPVITGFIALLLEKYGPRNQQEIRQLLKTFSINGRA